MSLSSLPHPLLTNVPDFGQPPKYGASTLHDRISMGTGPQTVSFPQRRPDQIMAFSFVIDDILEITTLKEFFRAQGGRAHPFYCPSWRRDLRIVGSALEGEKLVTIESPGEDYSATHLDDTEPDHYGRQVYFWRDGETVWAERIIRVLPGAEPGTEILDLDNPLPFDIDENTWIGWAHLVRFSEDQLEWRHLLPGVAEVSFTVRDTRHANQNELVVELEQLDQYGQLGFISCTCAPGEILPVTNRVAYAYGPETLHATQDDPYSMPWAAYPTPEGIRLRKAIPPANETIWLPQTGGTLSILFDAEVVTDHVALAFDQTAYEVVAYQKTATTIECRRFFNLAVETVEWEGQDPLLQYNALLDADLPTGETDVVCYYRKPGENALWMRFQRDNFGVEYLASLLPGRPIELKRAFFEYNEDESAGTLKVEFVDAGFRVGTLSSAAYPDPPPPPVPPYVLVADADDGEVSASLVGGSHDYAVIWADGSGEFDPHLTFLDAASVTAGATGEYTALVLYADGNDTDLGPHPAFDDRGDVTASISGAYTASVIEGEDSLAEAGAVGSVSISGVYVENVIFPPVTAESANVNTAISGVYEPA